MLSKFIICCTHFQSIAINEIYDVFLLTLMFWYLIGHINLINLHAQALKNIDFKLFRMVTRNLNILELKYKENVFYAITANLH